MIQNPLFLINMTKGSAQHLPYLTIFHNYTLIMHFYAQQTFNGLWSLYISHTYILGNKLLGLRKATKHLSWNTHQWDFFLCQLHNLWFSCQDLLTRQIFLLQECRVTVQVLFSSPCCECFHSLKWPALHLPLRKEYLWACGGKYKY